MRVDLARVAVVLVLCLVAGVGSVQASPGLLPEPGVRLLTSNDVTHLAIQPDGALIVGTYGHQSVGATDYGRYQPALIRLDPQGGLDPAWNAPWVDGLFALASGPDGSIYVSGQSVGDGFQGLARLDATTGAIDAAWATSLSGAQAGAFTFDANWVYAAGWFSVGGGSPRALIRIATATGEVDTSWAPQFDHGVQALAIGADGFMYAGGGYFDGAPHGRVSRVDLSSGEVDAAWQIDANNYVTGLATAATGAVLVTGHFTELGGQPRNGLGKVSAGGAVLAWNPAPDDQLNGLAVRGDEVYVAGRFGHIGGADRAGLARLSLDTGLVDPGWRADLDGRANALVVNGDVVAVGGDFNAVGPSVRLGVARLDASTALVQPSDDIAVPGRVFTIAPDGVGGYLVGGSFARAGDLVRRGLLRLRPDLTLDPAWAPGFSGAIGAVAVDSSSGDVYAGGAAGNGRTGILMRIDLASGEVDDGWQPDPDGPVYALVARDGVLHVAGAFTHMAGHAAPYLVRFQPGQPLPDPTWQPAPDDVVQALAFADDGKLFAGGQFTAIGGQTRIALARLDPTSGSAAGWQSAIDEGDVGDLSWRPDGALYAHGAFATAGAGAVGLARFDAGSGALAQVLADYPGNAMHVTADGAWVILDSAGEGLFRMSTQSGARDWDWMIRTEGNVFAIADGPFGSLLVGGEFPSVGQTQIRRWGLAAFADGVIFIDGFHESIYARPAPPPLTLRAVRAAPPLR